MQWQQYKIIKKQVVQFIFNHLIKLLKLFNKAKFIIKKTTECMIPNNKQIKLLLKHNIKMKKISFQKEKIAIISCNLLKYKLKPQLKILIKCKKDCNRQRKIKELK
jgi:hypothetical protein